MRSEQLGKWPLGTRELAKPGGLRARIQVVEHPLGRLVRLHVRGLFERDWRLVEERVVELEPRDR